MFGYVIKSMQNLIPGRKHRLEHGHGAADNFSTSHCVMSLIAWYDQISTWWLIPCICTGLDIVILFLLWLLSPWVMRLRLFVLMLGERYSSRRSMPQKVVIMTFLFGMWKMFDVVKNLNKCVPCIPVCFIGMSNTCPGFIPHSHLVRHQSSSHYNFRDDLRNLYFCDYTMLRARIILGVLT